MNTGDKKMAERTYVPLTQAEASAFQMDSKHYIDDFDLLMGQWDEVLNEYEGQFIAFADGKVVASAGTVEILRSKLPQDIQNRAVVRLVERSPLRCLIV